MSVTLTERHDVVASSSTVASSRRWRVWRPRSPGTRPSVVATCSASTYELRSTTLLGPDMTAQRIGPAPEAAGGGADTLSGMEQTLTRPLTRAQQARRQRVIDAAMALGLEGGYEAVQMRDVAARADVAMGTVYRYFTSKDHLLAATLVHWVELLDTRIGQHPPRGEHPADRVLDVLDRALRAMGRQPKLVTAVFTSLSSPDPAAVGCQQQITLLMEGIISRAIGESEVPDFADRARMIGHVWYSALVGWVNGWSTMARVYDELAVSVRLLLPDQLVERRTPA